MHRSTNSYMLLHADLFVRSMDVALTFYRDKLAFSVVDDATLQGAIAVDLSDGQFEEVRLVLLRLSRTGALLELQEFQRTSALTADARNYIPSPSLVTILVSNLASHIEEARRRGLEPSSRIFPVHLPHQGSCEVIFYKDPDGNRLEFLQVTSRQPPACQ